MCSIIFGEDFTSSDINILTASKSKVPPFYIRFIFDKFDGLMLHHEVGTFSFSEVLTWIKRGVDSIWGARMVNEVDWGFY